MTASNDDLPDNPAVRYPEHMDWIDEELDKIQHLNTLSGDEYIAEAERLGFVVTEKGLYRNPDHPSVTYRSIADNKRLLERLFERYGDTIDFDADTAATG